MEECADFQIGVHVRTRRVALSVKMVSEMVRKSAVHTANDVDTCWYSDNETILKKVVCKVHRRYF